MEYSINIFITKTYAALYQYRTPLNQRCLEIEQSREDSDRKREISIRASFPEIYAIRIVYRSKK